MLVLVIGAALLFDYVNGFHDTANAIATCISTRALSVKAAIIMAAGLNFAGAMISTKVASTIGKGIVDPVNVTQMVVLAGICRSDHLGPDHLVLRPSFIIIPRHYRRDHGGGHRPCRDGCPSLERSGKDRPGPDHFPDCRDNPRLLFHGGDDVEPSATTPHIY